ncbi:LOW QUALITY PROTEIN: hypothetical protein U9M48_040199 [Paspalum notatum var. saurae]|uniref:Uncharacterized protein n=1 Tax=Paspalum notatum var. saurae TaxID=547442 RepID=A0AAQ3UKI7_PASNO
MHVAGTMQVSAPFAVACRNRASISSQSVHQTHLERVSSWTATQGLDPRNWWPSCNLHHWWTSTDVVPSTSKKVCWEIWLERNNRIFNRSESPNGVVLQKIKVEAHLWAIAGAKGLATLCRLN